MTGARATGVGGREISVAGPRAPGPRTAILVALGVLVLDQVAKIWATATLDERSLRVVGDFVELELRRNSGGAFSLFPSATPVLTAAALLAVLVILRVAARAEAGATLLALGGVLGGTLGNLVDRIARDPGFPSGHVVDFVSVGSWPTFNVADAAITIGIGLLLVRSWRA